MSARSVTVAGAAGYAVGGPLLAVAAADALGTPGMLGVLAVWAGVGGLLAGLALVGRANHRLLRDGQARVASLDQRLAHLEQRVDGADPETIAARIDGVTAGLRAQLETHRDELLGTLDARVLGIHEVLRRSNDPRP